MEDARKTTEEEMIFHCDKCGNRLEPRTFDTEDGPLYGIFDNCTPHHEQLLFDTLKDAISYYKGEH